MTSIGHSHMARGIAASVSLDVYFVDDQTRPVLEGVPRAFWDRAIILARANGLRASAVNDPNFIGPRDSQAFAVALSRALTDHYGAPPDGPFRGFLCALAEAAEEGRGLALVQTAAGAAPRKAKPKPKPKPKPQPAPPKPLKQHRGGTGLDLMTIGDTRPTISSVPVCFWSRAILTARRCGYRPLREPDWNVVGPNDGLMLARALRWLLSGGNGDPIPDGDFGQFLKELFQLAGAGRGVLAVERPR
jgi:hypothetical protein